MSEPRINFLEDFSKKDISGETLKKTKKKDGFPFFLKIFLIIFISFFVFFSSTVFSNNSILNFHFGPLPQIGFSKVWIAVKGYLFNKTHTLKGEKEDRINILLLGMGGKGHDGPYLTDTIILVSIKPSTKEMALISIPRDLYVPIPGHGWRKINNANAFGEEETPGRGAILAEQTVSHILDLPIHYYVRIDFQGFKKLIDDLGGIRVYVERSFVDTHYPAPNHKYQTISFKKGWQKMDGEQALKFARSRHGTNGESSDFARAKRQQKIILAIKKKALSFSTLLDNYKTSKMIKNLEKSIQTDLTFEEIIRLAKITESIEKDNIINFTFDDSPNNFLIPGKTLDNAFILQPKTGNFKEMAYFVNHIFDEKNPLTQKEKEKELEKKPLPPAKLIVLNGTKKNGLAKKTALSLKTFGFSIIKIGNSPQQNYEKTVIYQLKKENQDSLIFLKEKLKANVSHTLPEFLKTSIPSNKENSVDFIIVLGKT